MFIASVMPSILWCPLLFCPQSFPGSGTFPMSRLFTSDDLNIGASASVLPVKYSGLISFRLSGLISLPSKGLAGVFSSTTVQRHQFLVLCLLYGPALTNVHDHWEDLSLDCMDLCWQSHCFSTHRLGSSLLSSQAAIIFWFHGCCHHLQWFWSPRRGNLSLLPPFPLLFAMQ